MNRRDFLKRSFSGAAVFGLASLGVNMFEAKIVNAASGDFYITDKCIGCHHCAVSCPQKAISGSKAPLVIDQSACIRCGACARVCPVQAIIRE